MAKPEENTTFIATRLASETAAKAADLATTTSATAVALATKTAETTGIISNDISWMKKSLTGIETTLAKMNDAFVTAAQHAEVLKTLDTQGKAIESLKTERTRTAVLLSIGIGLLTLLVSIMTYHILGR